MQRTAFPSGDSGFTLIEVLIAIAIFSIGILAMGLLQSHSLMRTGDIARKTEAWVIAAGEAERLKALRFYTDPATGTYPADLDSAVNHDNRPAPPPYNTRYDLHWLVEDNPASIPAWNNTTNPVLPGVGGGTYTVAKRITIVVTQSGGTADYVTSNDDEIARLQFYKTWAATRIP